MKYKTEQEMRDAKVEWFKTQKELVSFIKDLETMNHDYGTCVYAMSMAAEAAFNYMASKLGVTGFQASCADLDFLRRVRNIEGPFILLDAKELLYPQYNLRLKLEKFIDDNKEWARNEAASLLEETPDASEGVLNHWKKLSNNL